MAKILKNISLLICGLALLIGGCSLISPMASKSGQSGRYILAETRDTLLSKHDPIFQIEENQKNYNRIGTPTAIADESGSIEIGIDTNQATIYAMTQDFETDKGKYTNLIYRVHFPKTPLPHLTAGKNVGLFVYVTLNSNHETVLITTLHTCGCFLAFFPTSKLPESAWPKRWKKADQTVYGEKLPAQIEKLNNRHKLVIDLRSETHRVMDVRYTDIKMDTKFERFSMQMRPMSDLDQLPTTKKPVSFFISDGLRKGIVKGSNKPLEMVFMSLVAMDFFIGEDKALGPPDETGTKLYTSLKFWARDSSNIWFFPRFLKYWGWDL